MPLMSLVLAAGAAAAAASPTALEPATRAAIEATCFDYVDGQLEGDAERVARSLHPDLAKRRVLGETPDERLGVRRILGVPMLREGEPFGALVAGWYEAGPTPKQHEELLRTFADQAAIAIENVRLFNETKEALARQTATSEILGVISSSPTDIAPVFDAILKNATELSGAHLGILNLRDGEGFRTVAQRSAQARAR